jgi:hypothetical protein
MWGPRGVPHAFNVESESARALVLVTPGGFERMFEEGGVALAESAEPPANARSSCYKVRGEIPRFFGTSAGSCNKLVSAVYKHVFAGILRTTLEVIS